MFKMYISGISFVNIVIVSFTILFLSGCSCGGNSKRPDKPNKISNINFRKEFNDLNDKHLSVAKEHGLKNLSDKNESEKYINDKFVEINKTKAYKVDKLTHSIPYLVPFAADLLENIGLNFQDSLLMKHLPPYKIIVTSVLRTGDDVKRLGRNNVNASKNSAHCYGTTFDITYKRFESLSDEEAPTVKLKSVLGEVLRDLKKQGRCYVKHELKQACFHITARN